MVLKSDDNRTESVVQRGEAPVVQPTDDVELTFYGIGEGAAGPMLIEATFEYQNGVQSPYLYRIVDFNDVSSAFVATADGPRNKHVEDAIRQVGGEIDVGRRIQ